MLFSPKGKLNFSIQYLTKLLYVDKLVNYFWIYIFYLWNRTLFKSGFINQLLITPHQNLNANDACACLNEIAWPFLLRTMMIIMTTEDAIVIYIELMDPENKLRILGVWWHSSIYQSLLFQYWFPLLLRVFFNCQLPLLVFLGLLNSILILATLSFQFYLYWTHGSRE